MKNSTSIQQDLLAWYRKEARDLPWRSDPSPYKTWISEIMLQQTRVDTVIPYFHRFLAEIPTIQALAQVEEEKLLKLWQGLGYYSRALRLKEAALKITERFDGKLPSKVEDLLLLPGIGPYTAGAIASMAFGRQEPAADGNVLRIAARLTADKEDVSKAQNRKRLELFIKSLLPAEHPGDFNQALMDLGSGVCLPNSRPECDLCPLQEYCLAYQQDIVLEIPKKVQKNARRIEKKTVLILINQGRFAIEKRREKGLLANLWQFPTCEGHLTVEQCEALLQSKGVVSDVFTLLPPARHIFTHLEWDMRGFSVAVSSVSLQSEWLWVTKEEITQRYSIPTAFKSFIALCCEEGRPA